MVYSEEKTTPANLLTVAQVADLFGVHPNTIRRWERQGFLNAYRIGSGRHRRFDRKEAENLLNRFFNGDQTY